MEEVLIREIKNLLAELRLAGVRFPRSAALLSLAFDYMQGQEVTGIGYAKLWGWQRKTVANFIKQQGFEMRKRNKDARKSRSTLTLSSEHEIHPFIQDLANFLHNKKSGGNKKDAKNTQTNTCNNCALGDEEHNKDTSAAQEFQNQGINENLSTQENPHVYHVSGDSIPTSNSVVDVVVENQANSNHQSEENNQQLIDWAWRVTEWKIRLGEKIRSPARYVDKILAGKTTLTEEDFKELDLFEKHLQGGKNGKNNTRNGNGTGTYDLLARLQEQTEEEAAADSDA